MNGPDKTYILKTKEAADMLGVEYLTVIDMLRVGLLTGRKHQRWAISTESVHRVASIMPRIVPCSRCCGTGKIKEY